MILRVTNYAKKNWQKIYRIGLLDNS